MKKNKLLLVSISVLALGGIAYAIYYFNKKSRTTSKDPEKNNRNIVQNLVK